MGKDALNEARSAPRDSDKIPRGSFSVSALERLSSDYLAKVLHIIASSTNGTCRPRVTGRHFTSDRSTGRMFFANSHSTIARSSAIASSSCFSAHHASKANAIKILATSATACVGTLPTFRPHRQQTIISSYQSEIAVLRWYMEKTGVRYERYQRKLGGG